jgi:hypothetical protein
LETVESVSSTRDRGEKTPGVDTGAFNKVFRYRVPEIKPRWCRENIFERAERLARRVGEVVRRFVFARLRRKGVRA